MVTVVERAGNTEPEILTMVPTVVDEESVKQVIRLFPEGNPMTLNETDGLDAPVWPGSPVHEAETFQDPGMSGV
jgi:hypothetical protein